MKKRILFLSIIVPLLFLSCKKSSESPATTSEWTYNGNTFKDGVIAGYDDSSNELFASNNQGNFVRVFFSTPLKPTKSGTLTVLDYVTPFTNATQCYLQVGSIYGSNPIQPLSIGKAGDIVSLTVASSGKLTASFTNISVRDSVTIRTVSGKLIEQ